MWRSNSTRTAAVAITALILLYIHGAAVCKKPVIFGGLFPEETLEGIQEASAAKLAIDEINSNILLLPDYEIVWISRDSQRNTEISVGYAIDMAKRNVSVVIGAGSSAVSAALQSVFSPLGIPQISYASSSNTLGNKIYSTFTRVVGPDEMNMIAMSAVLVTFGIEKVGILYENTQYGLSGLETLNDELVSNGIELGPALSFSKDTSDLEFMQMIFLYLSNGVRDLIVIAVENSGLHFVDYMIKMGMLYSEGQSCNFTFRLYFSDGMCLNSVVMTTNGTLDQRLVLALNGHLGVRPYVSHGPEYQKFMKKWNTLNPAEYPGAGPDTDCNTYGLYAYDAVYLAALALHNITHTSSTSEINLSDFYDTIVTTQFEGVTGFVEMDRDRDRIIKLVEIVNFKNQSGPVPVAFVNNSVENTSPYASINWIEDVVDGCGVPTTMNTPVVIFPLGGIISPIGKFSNERMYSLMMAIHDFNFNPDLISDNFILHFHVSTELKAAEDPVKEVQTMSYEHKLMGILPPIDLQSELAVQGVATTLGTTQIGFVSRSSRFSDNLAFPNMVRLVPELVDQIDSLFSFIGNASMGWNRAFFFIQQDLEAIIIGNQIRGDLRKNFAMMESYHILDIRTNITHDDAIAQFLDLEYRVAVIVGDANFTLDLLYAANKRGAISPEFAYLMTELSLFKTSSDIEEPGVRSNTSICEMMINPNHSREECNFVMDGTIAFKYSLTECNKAFTEKINASLEHDTSGIPYVSLPWDRMTCLAYDVVMSVAGALSMNMSHIIEGGLLQDNMLMEDIDEGYTGSISFNSKYNSRNGIYTLYNYQTSGFVAIGIYDRQTLKNFTKPLFHGGSPIPPSDRPSIQYSSFVYYLFLSVATALAIGALVYILVLSIIFVVFRKNPIIKASNLTFSLLILLGASLPAFALLLQVLVVALYLVYPIDLVMSITCNIRNWLTRIGYFMVFSALFIKTYALAKIFDNKKLRLKIVTRKRLLSYFFLILSLFIILKAVITALVPLAKEEFSSSNHLNFLYTEANIVDCGFLFYIYRDQSLYVGFVSYFIIEIGAIALLVLFGLYQTYRVRNIHKRFREVREILFCIYYWVVIMFLGYPLALVLLYTSRPLFFFFSSFAEVAGIVTTMTFLFVPKIYRLIWFHYFRIRKRTKVSKMLINPNTGKYVE